MQLKLGRSSINYFVSVGRGGGSPKDDLLYRPYLISKDNKREEGQKFSIHIETTWFMDDGP